MSSRSSSNQFAPSQTSRLATSFNAWLPIAIGLGLWSALCAPLITGSTVVGFRDSAYLYYPLFAWIDAQWAAGEIPLWNPNCNFGMPVVGDGTTSLLYPGKLIFCFRFLSYPSRYGIYLSLHLLVAGVGTYWLARVLRANPAGATLAAISYACGGCVIFQVTNVIYLVSAAWLPIALGCIWRMKQSGQGRWRWAIAAGACCALMILGGDPQMVYHVGLIAAATSGFGWWNNWKRLHRAKKLNARDEWKQTTRSGLNQLVGLSLLVVVTVGLSLVQLLPSIEWARLSERTQSEQAINIYQLILAQFDSTIVSGAGGSQSVFACDGTTFVESNCARIN